MNDLASVPLPLYRLQNSRSPEQLVRTRAQAGATAVLLFTTKERARQFIDGKKLSERLSSVRMDESAAAHWLVDVESQIAAELVVIDADPTEVLHQRCEPLNEVLIDLRSAAHPVPGMMAPIGP